MELLCVPELLRSDRGVSEHHLSVLPKIASLGLEAFAFLRLCLCKVRAYRSIKSVRGHIGSIHIIGFFVLHGESPVISGYFQVEGP